MRPVVVPAGEEVVLPVRPEPVQQLPGTAQIRRHGCGGDVTGGQQVALCRSLQSTTENR
jgi:hypothetical protein